MCAALFAMYVPPLMEALGRAEVEHNAKNNRMRAVRSRRARQSEINGIEGSARREGAT
jgi:hypothetical protein